MSLPKFEEQVETKAENEEARPGKIAQARARGEGAVVVPVRLAELAIEELEKQIKATKRMPRVDAPGQWEDIPDYSVRQKAIETALAYVIGRPVERQMRITGDVSTYGEKLARLVATPAGLDLAMSLGLVEPLKDAKSSGRMKAAKEEKHHA